MKSSDMVGIAATQIFVRDDQGCYQHLFVPQGRSLNTFLSLNDPAVEILFRDPNRRVYVGLREMSPPFEVEPAVIEFTEVTDSAEVALVTPMLEAGLANAYPLTPMPRVHLSRGTIYSVTSNKPFFAVNVHNQTIDVRLTNAAIARVLEVAGVETIVATSRYSLALTIAYSFRTEHDAVLRAVKSAIHTALADWEENRIVLP